MKCEHKHRIKAISIPINETGELDYEKLLEIVTKINTKDIDKGFAWFEVLVCIDCNTVLEKNIVGISNDVGAPSAPRVKVEYGEFECGDIKLVISASDEYNKLQVNDKYDLFFNLDGSYDGIGIDMPDVAEQEEFRKRMMEDESPVETVTKGPDDYVRTHR